MRRAISIAVAGVVTSTIAAGGCGYGYQMKNDKMVGTTTVTSGPPVGERELSRSFGAISTRIADEVCAHETRCGRPQSAACADEAAAKADAALSRWHCDPAEIRARAEQCLATLPMESCELDLTARAAVCPDVVGCTHRDVQLVSPGESLAKVWRADEANAPAPPR